MKGILRILISIGLLGVSLAVFLFLVWPQYEEYGVLKAQVEEKRERLSRGETTLVQLKEMEGAALAHQKDFDKIEDAIPQDAGLPTVYDHIQQLGIESGLVLTLLEGEPKEDLVQKVLVLAFKAEFVGSYEGLKSFLEKANRSARILNVDTLHVMVDTENPEVLEISLELFIYVNP